MKNSNIEWTHHTFQPWIGCVKVSPGCAHCYAENLDKRFSHHNWGPAKTTERRAMSEAYWRQPYRWNEAARKAGQRARVFCASMADVFEDHPQVVEWRARLWRLIEETPNLDWLLLTKRPEHIRQMVPSQWLAFPRENVWYGTSVENQEYADKRVPALLSIPAKVHFLSCEPLLGPIDLSAWMVFEGQYEKAEWMLAKYGESQPLDWVIAGGESGHGARPMHPQWARALRDQCSTAGVPYFFKQWGEYTPYYEACDPASGQLFLAEYERGMKRVGKKAAGRLLDGRTWDEWPA